MSATDDGHAASSATANGGANGGGSAAAWRERAVERSLRGARARALSRSERFISAASDLLTETGRTDFTVQQLVERSKTSLRSFYQHFGSKDELLLALFEELIRANVEQWRAESEQYDSYGDRLEAIITRVYGSATGQGHGGMSRALTLYHLQLAESRPDDFAAVLGPQRDLVLEIVQGGVAAGEFRQDIEPQQLTLIVMQTLVAAAHMHALGAYLTGEPLSPDELWRFMAGGLRHTTPTETGGARRRRPVRGTRHA